MGLRKLVVLIFLLVVFTAESEESALRLRRKRESDFTFEDGTAAGGLEGNFPDKPIKPLIWQNDGEKVHSPGGALGHAEVHPVPEPPKAFPEKAPTGWSHRWEDLKHKARHEWNDLKHKAKAKWEDTKEWFGNWWHSRNH